MRKYELSAYLKGFIQTNSSKRNKFLILSSNRTGSTLLANLLNSHNEIRCDGEIFLGFTKLRFKKVLFPYLYIEGLCSAHTEETYGFCLKTHHMQMVFYQYQKDFIFNLSSNGWKILYLKRLNTFRQALSHLIAVTTGKWHNFSGKPLVREKVHIDCNRLLRIIDWFEETAMLENEILTGIEHMEIIYENSLLNTKMQQNTCDRVCKYLELEPEKLTTKMSRISPGYLGEQVENYGEVRDFIEQTGYVKFLEDKGYAQLPDTNS